MLWLNDYHSFVFGTSWVQIPALGLVILTEVFHGSGPPEKCWAFPVHRSQ